MGWIDTLPSSSQTLIITGSMFVIWKLSEWVFELLKSNSKVVKSRVAALEKWKASQDILNSSVEKRLTTTENKSEAAHKRIDFHKRLMKLMWRSTKKLAHESDTELPDMNGFFDENGNINEND